MSAWPIHQFVHRTAVVFHLATDLLSNNIYFPHEIWQPDWARATNQKPSQRRQQGEERENKGSRRRQKVQFMLTTANIVLRLWLTGSGLYPLLGYRNDSDITYTHVDLQF